MSLCLFAKLILPDLQFSHFINGHEVFAILSSDELEQKCSPFLQTEEGALTTYLDFNYYIVIFFSNSFLKSSILLASIKIGVIEEKTTGFLE